MSKEIIKGHDARTRIKAGIDKACDAVRPTLGAVGMTSLIEFEGLDPVESDDGVTILKNLSFKDRYENMGVQMLRKAAIRTSTEGGDGTATTTVLTQALVSEAFREIANDSSKIREVRERLDEGLKQTLDSLWNSRRTVTEDDIEKIANISSLDPEVAKLIAEIIKEVGVNGVVTVEKGSKIGYSKEVVKGAKFDKGLISHYFINEPSQERCVLENPYILLVDRKVSIADQVKSIMDDIERKGNKSILIVADDVDGLALASLIQNNATVTVVDQKGQPKTGTYSIACVRNPYTASRAGDFLMDMAALTGGTVISEQAGMRLDNATADLCGSAEKVIVTKESTIIVGGRSGKDLESRIDSIRNEIESTTSEYSKAMLEERLACLTGGVGVIRVGTYTDTEFNAKKYKFDNAINATQAALQEGILPGGGVALAKAKVDEPIFRKALIAPIMQMATNAGMNPHEVAMTVQAPYGSLKVLGLSMDGDTESKDYGIDFRSKTIVDMFDSGIIDPYKVVRIALESATAIAKSLIGVETAIVTEDEEKQG